MPATFGFRTICAYVAPGAEDHPLLECLGAAEVVDQVVAGDDVELVVEDQHGVGLVRQGGGASEVVDSHPLARLEP
jgi:hypothetical protein